MAIDSEWIALAAFVVLIGIIVAAIYIAYSFPEEPP